MYPMVLNCVMHRYNLPHVEQIIKIAEAMDADFLELANTQYYGWARLNRDALMPTTQGLADTAAIVDHHRERLSGRMKILWVSPDYADAKPKACMNGWGSVFLLVAPDAVPQRAHAAGVATATGTTVKPARNLVRQRCIQPLPRHGMAE